MTADPSLLPCSRGLRAALLLGASLAVNVPSFAVAQEDPAATGPVAAGAGAPADLPASADDAAVDGEIVVTAPTTARSAARVAPDFEISAAEVELYAADSIAELLSALGPRTGTSEPVVLVNGERVDGAGIGSYPPEAIERIEVLPPAAAAIYGFEPGRQLVNIILKRRFASSTVQAGASGATQGGGGNYDISVQRVSIAGTRRGSLRIEARGSDRLLESARDIPLAEDALAVGTRVRAPVSGAEIDPALSAVAGYPVIAAAVPPGLAGAPALADFVAVGDGHAGGEGAYRTILPSAHSLSIAADMARPLGRFQASLAIDIRASSSESLLGLTGTSLLLSADNGWSPFSRDVIVDHAAARPLTGRQDSLGTSLAATLAGPLGGWQLSAGSSYDLTLSRSRIELGADRAALQAKVDSGAANPFVAGSLSPLVDARRTLSHNAAVTFAASKIVARLPAGPVHLSLSADGAVNRTNTEIGGPVPDVAVARSTASGTMSISLPVVGEEGPLAALGTIALQLGAGGTIAAREPARTRLNAGIAWAPLEGLSVNAMLRRSTSAPQRDQIDAPLVETPNVRVYDFVAGERVDVIRVTGGNPALGDAVSEAIDIRLMARPAFLEGFTAQLAYSRSEERGAVGALPALTAAVEAAYPERFLRAVDGRLERIDARPINIARSLGETLTTNVGWTLGLGGNAARDDPGRDGGNGGGDDATEARRTGPAGRRGMGNRQKTALAFGLSHSWKLADEIVLRDGLAPLDRLRGDGGAGAPRHSLSASARLSLRGVGGLALEGRWASPTTARSDGVDRLPGTRLDFSSKTEVGVRLYADMGRIDDGAWAKGLRLALDVDNLFDQRVRVVDRDGQTPAGFTRDELDPLGRTVKLSLRKML
ncbi:TonB-dependent Receptor Plug Domain [Sphingopyxis sp. YR583]|uniref:TonB-dependent receptor n=1 Tax=Sphingopyxis sp. YR583 TaxID=1881047 RepID=UPI0008A7BBD2|nr:TonB-dependent receptor [Sphingopyxis sp. YR583]SEH12813.1 TonB-dependent Receptor Plug Domain [Sphingopyxis sp. YR583]